MFKKIVVAVPLVLLSGSAFAESGLLLGFGHLDTTLNINGQGKEYSLMGTTPTVTLGTTDFTMSTHFYNFSITSSFSGDDVEVENNLTPANGSLDYFRAETMSGVIVGDTLFSVGGSHERYKFGGLAEYGATSIDFMTEYLYRKQDWSWSLAFVGSLQYTDADINLPGANYSQNGFGVKGKVEAEGCYQPGAFGACLVAGVQGQRLMNDDDYKTSVVDLYAGLNFVYKTL